MGGLHDEQVYRDFSRVSENDSERMSCTGDYANSVESNFPMKLHFLLQDVVKDGLDNVVSWQPHGRSFIVRKHEAFVKRMLPLYFRQGSYASFQRQLNLYGFKRITTGRDKGGYYHELFLRGKEFLGRRILRTKIKGQGSRKPGDPQSEPDFYAMPFLPPLSDNSKSQPVIGSNTLVSPDISQSLRSCIPSLFNELSSQRMLGNDLLTLQYTSGLMQSSPCPAPPGRPLMLYQAAPVRAPGSLLDILTWQNRLARYSQDLAGDVALRHSSAQSARDESEDVTAFLTNQHSKEYMP